MIRKESMAAKAPNKIWKLLAPIVVLCSICLVITAALAGTNQVTRPVIDAAAKAKADAALQVVLPEGQEFRMMEGLQGLPDSVLPQIYQAGNGAGYVIFVTGKGFGGDMSIIVGISAEGKITGTKVLEHGETAGIGTKVVDDDSPYQQQLIGMSDTSGIEATSGATVSSGGMKAAVQAAFDAYTIASGGTVEDKVAARPASCTDDVLDRYYPGATFTEAPGGLVSDAGTVVFASSSGMESEVAVAVCFDTNGSILGITVDAMGETEGYGTQCGEAAFTDRFKGVKSAGEVDGISGATVTSDAVKTAVDRAIADYETVKGAA